MQILKQSTAVDVLIGPFVDRTDGYTAEEGESPSVLLSKNGQALAAKNDSTTPTHDDAGYYNCELDATDTGTVGTLVLVVEASANALPVRHEFQVVEEAVYEALFAPSAPGYGTAQTGDTYALANGDHGFVSIQDDIDDIKTKTDYLPSATAGASGGLFIVGANTGAVSITNSSGTALTLTSSGGGGNGLGCYGNGNGSGIYGIGGTGLIACGMKLDSQATASGHGLCCIGSSGHGVYAYTTGSSKHGMAVVGKGDGYGLYCLGGDSSGTGAVFKGGDSDGDGAVFEGTGDGDGAVFHSLSGGGGIIADEISAITTYVDCLPATLDGSTFTSLPGVTLANDAITAAKFDESTAFPLTSADTGATAVARTGADSDTLETLSDQLDTVDTNVDAVLADTGTDGVVVAAASKTGYKLASDGLDSVTLPADIITASSINTGAFTADAFAADALVAATFATDSISADAIAADAIAEINVTVDTALADINLDHLMLTGDATLTNIVADNTALAHLMAIGADISDYDSSTDSLEAIRDRGDADWSSGGATNPNMLLEAEVATVNSQTEFTLATGSDEDDAYNSQAIVLYDDSNSDYPSVRAVSDYVGATKTVTIDSAPDFTLGTDDSVRIFVTAPGSTAPTAAAIRAEIDSNSTQLAAIVEDTGTTLDTLIKDIPTNAEFAAALPTNFASLSINASGHVARVVLCDTTTTNTDMRGTDSASTHSAADVKTAIEAAGGHLALILADTGTDIPATLSIIDGYVDCLPATLDGSTFTSLPDVTLADGAHGGSSASLTLSDYSDFQGEGASLTAEDIADAVWDETVADHSDVGSTGAAIAAAGGSGDPWSTALPGAYSAGTAGYIIGNMEARGSGADEVTITWTAGGSPVADADVWVTSDAAGTTVVAGTLQTNSSGQATFLLDAGETYYLFGQKDSVNPLKGRQFTAVAD